MKKRKLKKNVLIVSCIVLILLILVLFVKRMPNESDTISDSMVSDLFTENSLKDSRTLDLEYKNEELNPMDYISTELFTVTVNPKTINLGTIGDTEVVYTITKDKESKDVKCTFSVKDTQAPVIILNQDEMTVSSIEGVDFTSNLQSVEDPVDGTLLKMDQAPEKLKSDLNGKVYDTGWYTVQYNDSDSVVTVHAEDNHGNITEKTFKVNVDSSDSEGAMYYYPSLDLNDGSEWIELDSNFTWYYSSCTYMSGKYQSVEEALQDVVNHENAEGNTTNVEDNARIFCEKDKQGNILYYQAGIED